MVLGTRFLISIIDYFLSLNNSAKILKLAVEMALPLQTEDFVINELYVLQLKVACA